MVTGGILRREGNNMYTNTWPMPQARVRNGGPTMRVGDRVRLNTPDNERLHQTEARVTELTDWGAHCTTSAAATGVYRAVWEEMVLIADYVGECCQLCGGMNLRWAGKCKLCDNCGEAGGCG